MKISKKMTLIALPFFIVLVAAGVYLFTRPVNPTSTSAQAEAPNFTFALLDNKQVKLSDYLDKKPVVLNFWASWCPPCRQEAPVLAKVARKYDDKVQFLGVVVNDTPEKAKSFEREFDVPYPSGLDDNGSISTAYKVSAIPKTFFISKDGRVVSEWVGAIDTKTLTGNIEKLLKTN